MLTFEALGGTAEGVVTFNGMTLSSQLFKAKCGLVAQEDYHWAFLTCRETIAFAADLLSPNASQAEKDQAVSSMISKMGLDSCAETVVGNAFKHGLSGGQKRRLSVAVAMMKKLEVIFLDEPTSGLDAAAASGIMTFLSEITRTDNLITIFTVHQPSTNIFNSFDRVMLLSKGRTAYVGRKDNVANYLAMIGHPLPAQTNPAEFMLDIVNTDFTDDAEVEKILSSFDRLGRPEHQSRIQERLLSFKSHNPADPSLVPTQASIFDQTVIMFRRNFLLSIRDPLIYIGRIVMFFIICIFFGIIYVQARNLNQSQTLSHMWMLVWCIAVPSNCGVIAVYVFNTEFFTIKKEVKNGMVNTASYLFANSLLQIPVMFLFGISAISVSEYGIVNYNGAHYGQFLLIYALTMYAFESLAQMLAVAFKNPLLGMMQYVNLWFASFLFCGLFLRIADITWPFRILSYILPFQYTLRTMVYQEYIDSTWTGAVDCDPSTDASCYPGGYTCPGLSSSDICYGHTGTQVLDSMHQQFYMITATNHFSEDVGNLIAIAVVYKIVFIVLMTVRAREESTLHPPSTEKKITPTGSVDAIEEETAVVAK